MNNTFWSNRSYIFLYLFCANLFLNNIAGYRGINDRIREMIGVIYFNCYGKQNDQEKVVMLHYSMRAEIKTNPEFNLFFKENQATHFVLWFLENYNIYTAVEAEFLIKRAQAWNLQESAMICFVPYFRKVADFQLQTYYLLLEQLKKDGRFQSYGNVRMVGLGKSLRAVCNLGLRFSSEKIGILFALDPKGIHIKSKSNALKNCAAYVQVLHTNKFIGNTHQIGNADFDADGGSIQPVCITAKDTNECSHYEAVKIFTDSFLKTFDARKKTESASSSVIYGIRADRNENGKFFFSVKDGDHDGEEEEEGAKPPKEKPLSRIKRIYKTLTDSISYSVF